MIFKWGPRSGGGGKIACSPRWALYDILLREASPRLCRRHACLLVNFIACTSGCNQLNPPAPQEENLPAQNHKRQSPPLPLLNLKTGRSESSLSILRVQKGNLLKPLTSKAAFKVSSLIAAEVRWNGGERVSFWSSQKLAFVAPLNGFGGAMAQPGKASCILQMAESKKSQLEICKEFIQMCSFDFS